VYGYLRKNFTLNFLVLFHDMKKIWFLIKFTASFLLSILAISLLFYREFSIGSLISSLILLVVAISPWLVQPYGAIVPKNKLTKRVNAGLERVLMLIIAISFFGIVYSLGISVDYAFYLVMLALSAVIILIPVVAVMYQIKIQRNADKLARSSAKKSAEINGNMHLMLGQLKSDDANALRRIIESLEEDRTKKMKIGSSFIVPFLFIFAMGIAMLILTFFNFK